MFVKTIKNQGEAMSQYKHLTLCEREKLLFFVGKGYSVAKIASELGRSRSTIYRELKRNSKRKEYLPVNAQKKYEKRRKKCHRHKLLEDVVLYELVKDRFLNHRWSPEQIANRLRIEGSEYSISYNTIYRAIYAGMFDTPEQLRSQGNRGMKRRLRHKGKPRHKKREDDRRGKIAISHSIEERPEEAKLRMRLGDWEADTVLGKQGKACLVTLVDRKSRYLRCMKVESHTSEAVASAIITLLKDLPHKTITPDRGREFGRHAEVTQALDDVQFYFALPHHPWQRGTNENTNGLLREYFPKGYDITDVSDEDIQRVENELNSRPRKCLAFLSPHEFFFR